MLRKRLLICFTVTALALTTLGGCGRRAASERFERLGHRMVCTCGCNQILLECNHVGCPASDGMRNELKAAMNNSSSDDDVLSTFVAKYGPPVLAAPLTTGFGRVAWVMPFAVLLFAVLGCVYLVRDWRTRSVAHPAFTPLPADSAQAELLRQRAREETQI